MTVPPGLLAVPAAAPSISGAAARSYGFQAACSWGGLLVLLGCAAPWIGLPLAVVWLLGGAVAALPWLGRAPAEALNVLAWLYLGLLGTIVALCLCVLLSLPLGPDFLIVTSCGCVSVLAFIGMGLLCTWMATALLLTTAPQDVWWVELGRVLTIALLPAGPLAGVGGLLGGELGQQATTAGLWPTLWIAPELGGTLTGLGVSLLGALVVRRACAEEEPHLDRRAGG